LKKEETIMSITVSKSVLQELKNLLGKEPDLTTSRGSLFISKSVPASCISLRRVTREEYLRFVMDLPGFKQAYKVIPVDDQPFDVVILGAVIVDGTSITIDGKAANIL
jgi:hypothetical protein